MDEPALEASVFKASIALFTILFVSSPAFAQIDYRVLSTAKTTTMEKEMNEAGALGYKFVSAMGGAELVIISRKRK